MCLLTLASAVHTLTFYHSSSHEVWKFTPMKYLKFCITVSFWLCLISSEVSFGLYRQVVGINFVLAYNREAFGHLFSHESHVSLKNKNIAWNDFVLGTSDWKLLWQFSVPICYNTTQATNNCSEAWHITNRRDDIGANVSMLPAIWQRTVNKAT